MPAIAIAGDHINSEDASRSRPPFWSRLSLAELAALLFGYLYVTGYYVDSVFLGNLGIQVRELLRLDYIRTGFIFTLLILTFTLLPAGTVIFTYSVRKKHRLPHLHLGAIGNSLNTVFSLGFLVCIAIFVTRYELEYRLPKSVLGIQNFKAVIATAVAMSIFGMAVLPGIERFVVRTCSDHTAHRIFGWIIEPLRYGILILGLFILTESLTQFDWVIRLLHTSFFFLSVACFLGVLIASIWVRFTQGIRFSWIVYGLIGFGVMALYFFAITSYVLGPYTYIPINRGGRLPLTKTYLALKEPVPGLTPNQHEPDKGLIGPVFVIEEHPDVVYVASMGMEQWTTGFVPLQVVRSDNIIYRRLDRVADGFPRTLTSKAP
ncbi:MAG TPA: hypothetical protein VHE55_09995 [Fimbriimonadaceae bacterium]|nr:hypothetical protein [Fimbriimonadaceae bacterium]